MPMMLMIPMLGCYTEREEAGCPGKALAETGNHCVWKEPQEK